MRKIEPYIGKLKGFYDNLLNLKSDWN